MTSIPGLFAAGECDYMYHGANRLGANSLLSASYSGYAVGPRIVDYVRSLERPSSEIATQLFESENKKQEENSATIYRMDGPEDPFLLHQELGEIMNTHVGVVRYNNKLQLADEKIQELMERYRRIGITDTSHWANQTVSFTRQLWNMLELARVVTLGAYYRNESRGSHYKPEHPDRNDEDWLKTTRANWTPDGPKFNYSNVDISLLEPRQRRYDVAGGGKQ